MTRTITTVDELKSLDLTISQICENLPITPGSLSRMHRDFYPAYGIHIPKEAWPELEAYSLSCFESEWAATDAETNRAIERAITKANIASGNLDLNGQVSKMLISILKECHRSMERIVIVDIGAGDGDTTEAVLDALDDDKEDGREIARKCHFRLIEPSWFRLEDATQKLNRNNVSSEVYHGNTGSRYLRKCQTLETYLAEAKCGDVDVVISSAALHHLSFPTYLPQLNRLMKDNAVLVSGDWHNNLLRHPANLVNIIRALGAEKCAIENLELMFGIKADDSSRVERNLPPSQKKANRDFHKFVVALGNEMGRVGNSSKIAFLEALNIVDVRAQEMNDAGIVTDLSELRASHRGFMKMDRNIRRLLPEHDVAFVVAGAKIAKRA